MESKKKAGVVILISYKMDFKPTKTKRDKEGHYIMAKGLIQQKAGVAILVSDKIDFKATKTKRDKEGHFIMVKGSMQQE